MSRGVRGSYLPGHNVRLVRGGRHYFDLLLKLINEAKHTILLQVYIFEEDETGNHIAEALMNAARRNVHVYVLVDGYASQNLSSQFIDQIRDSGIYFKRFEPLFKSRHFYFGRRLHHKVMVVDSLYATVAGVNIGNRYNDMPGQPAWLDWALYVEGEAAKLLHKICVKRLRRPKLRPLVLSNEKLHALANAKDCLVRVRENDWVGRKRHVYNSYLEMFRYASHEIVIMSPYFLPGNEFRKKMRRAVARGVKIKLVLAGISDIFLSKHAERFVYRWLIRNGIEIYEYQKNVLHGKLAVCDGQWLTVGSYNVNDLSAHASIELNLDVKNANFVSGVMKQLEEIIQEECVCITGEVYKKYSILQHVVQRFAYDFFRLVLFLFTFYFRQRE